MTTETLSRVPAGSHRWAGRPFASWVLRVGIVAVPVAASFTTAWVLTSVTAVPTTILGAVVRWVLVAAAATLVLVAAERLTRRLAPLATLLALSLTFPDRAPPRFRVALRNGSTRQLRDRIAEARRGELGNTPAEAAERVLELVAALSVHDRTTRGHSERVRAYSRMIGEEVGLNEAELDGLQWAGLLHDAGKLMIPSKILNKPGSLTADEYEEVCLHPEYGRGMVAPLIPWLGESARAVWEHHERWDGGGYPSGLAGVEIALAARIVSVADTFDVMTSARSYKKPVSAALARTELARCAGGQFDETIVRAFLNISIGRLRLVMGPMSWLAQVPLFPRSVLSGAVGGHAATFAATFAIVGAGTFAVDHVDTAAGRASPVRHAENGAVVESLAATPQLMPLGRSITTSLAAIGHVQVVDETPPSSAATSPVVAAFAPLGRAEPVAAQVISAEPRPLSTPVATPPAGPVATLPSVTVVTQPTVPVVTTPSVPDADDLVVVAAPTTTTVPAGPRVNLGLASSFGVLAYAAVTSTGPTTITGDVGSTTTCDTGLTAGQMHGGEIFATTPAIPVAAHAGAAAAQLFLDGLTATPLPGVELGGRTITPGVYQGGTIGLTGTVTLDGGGDPNALFVFKAASTLVTASSSHVVLVNGAQARNVFWQVGSSATLGTYTQFSGTVIAYASITATTGVTVDGRLIARTGAVTLDSNTIVVPA
jgi:HD-GYP domain-containing protein (c-di-GMP phosphodiesterase class II)